jgi:hypothetical protein
MTHEIPHCTLGVPETRSNRHRRVQDLSALPLIAEFLAGPSSLSVNLQPRVPSRLQPENPLRLRIRGPMQLRRVIYPIVAGDCPRFRLAYMRGNRFAEHTV